MNAFTVIVFKLQELFLKKPTSKWLGAKMAFIRLLLEWGLYKTIGTIFLGPSDWTSPSICQEKTLFPFTLLPFIYAAFLPLSILPMGGVVTGFFRTYLQSPQNAKNTENVFLMLVYTWYWCFSRTSPPYLKYAFTHAFTENSCFRPHKYLQCYVLSCTSVSIISFTFFHVTMQ